MEEKDKLINESDAFSSALSGILSNPEMMSMISSLADKLKSSPVSTSSEQSEISDSSEKQITPTEQKSSPAMSDLSGAMEALAPLLSGSALKGSTSDNNRACLLRALKPYLSKSRCDAIDQIITVSKLSYLFKSR